MQYGFHCITVYFPDIKVCLISKKQLQPVPGTHQSEPVFIPRFVQTAGIPDHQFVITTLKSEIIVTVPPCNCLLIPCLMAFSTRVCSIMGGIG